MLQQRRWRARALLALVLLGLSAMLQSKAFAAAGEQDSLHALIGVWGGEKSLAPAVQGALFLAHEGPQWWAELQGYRVKVEEKNGIISFADFRGGSFRGRFIAHDEAIVGHWIQPAVFGQQFSTPVRLEKTGASTWSGDVRPLSERLGVFLVVEPGSAGAVRAWIRNPELNFGRFFSISRVRREGEHVQFLGKLAWQQDGQESLLFEGEHRQQAGTLSLFLEGFGGTHDLTRIDPEVSEFLPRPWAHGRYEYQPPLAGRDGWETADLASVGMAVKPMERLVGKIISTPMDAIDAPAIDAVLVARHGKLVLEEYFHGHGRDRPHDTRSASKSITATMVGAANQAGLLELDQGVYAAMYGESLPPGTDPRAARMTLRHLLTMSSGLACDDWDADSPGGEDRMQGQSEQRDWYQYTLGLPMLHEPGEHAAYCSGGMNLAGGVLSRATHMPLTEFFDQYLAEPLQLHGYHVNLMPTGEAYAGGGLRLTGRDFLKFGQLMLDDGVWNGRRVLGAGWARDATARHVELGTRREGYGYGWWLFDYELDGTSWSAFYAGGNGGNYIICVPALDLVIVFLATNYNQSVMHETKYEYVPEFILRSCVEGARDAQSR